MKKFFLYLALVAAVVLAADRLLGFTYDRLYAHTKTGQTGGKINHYLTLPQQPEIVIMGNSRAFYQIIPDSFPAPTFNLCHAGMSQIFQNGLLSVITDQKRLPRTILLHVDPLEYANEVEQPTDIQTLRYYAGRDSVVNRFIATISPYERYKYFFATYRYNGRVINLVKNVLASRGKTSAQLGDGYERLPPTDRDSTQTIYSAKQDRENTWRAFQPKQLRHLQWFIARCKAENVRLICFTSPFYERIPAIENACLQMGKLLRSQGVPYIDYVQHPLVGAQNHPTYWKDSHHLNELGAKLESHDLARQVRGLLAAPPVLVPPPVATE
jgi:hypothetical protein